MRKSDKPQANIAVYAGTFDPITNGHKDIVKRALSLFDKVIVGIADGGAKQPLFPTAERTAMVKEALLDLKGEVIVEPFSGLLVDYVRKVGARVVIRGLRAVSDYEYEAQMAIINRRLEENIETVFLMTSEHCSFISASIVREVARLGGDISALVPPNVAERLKSLFEAKK